MSTGAIVAIVFAVIVLFALGAWLAHRAAQARREELAAFAKQRGWKFDAHDSNLARTTLERLPPFDRGSNRRAYNTMRGDLATELFACAVMAGDYRYEETSGSGDDRRTTTYELSYIAFALPFAHVPDLAVRAEGLMDKLAGAFGFDDIDFESEEFSRKFHVKSPDRRFAYDVMHPRMMEFLLAREAPRIDLVGGHLCLTTGTGTWSAERFEYWLLYARAFFGLWPRHLVEELAR